MSAGKTKTKLLLSTALAVAAAAAPVLAQAQAQAQAQTQPSTQGSAPATTPNQANEVIITGTSIRGVAPVGSNLISTTRADIDKTAAQTVQQVLRTVPAVTGLTAVTQGGYNSNDSSGAYGPSIHGIGGVNSNSTLVLIDGHRFPLSGVNGNISDPTMIPTNALERVEVLPDGASSIYGSDAVAGVINFITRGRFSGLELTGQTGFGDDYRTYDAGAIMGKTWDSGFAWLAYDYSNQSAIPWSARPYTWPNHIPSGGTNNNTFYCSPASVQPTGSSLIYQYPYASGFSNAQSNAPCNSVASADLIPAETKQSVMLRYQQDITDRLTISGDAVYSNRTNRQNIADGTLTATVFGPGSTSGVINPFYTAPAGSSATSETVRLDLDQLAGKQAYALAKNETYYATGKAEYKLDDNWRLTGMLLLGANTSTTTTYNSACVSCATLALNGTTNANGNSSTPSIIGTNITVLNPTLTAANALDPFNPLGSNRTSPAVLAGLVDGPSYASARQTIQQYDLKLDGALFRVPAGDVKVAMGAEYLYEDESPSLLSTLNIGPISQGAYTSDNLHYQRNVKSGFAEGLVPIISPEMQLPFVEKFDIDLSGRYDDYSDFGSTFNPKFGATWEVVTGVKLRGDIASSFVAPPLTAIGQNGVAINNSIGSFLGPFSVPLALYPQAKQIPGCATATTVCTFNTTAVQGVVIQGGNANLKAQTGQTWTVGADFAPPAVPGLTASFTYWHNQFDGGVTSPIPALALGSAAWSKLLTIYPTGATAAQLAALSAGNRQTSVFPQTVYWAYNFVGQNALNLTVEGIDGNVQYGHSFDWGRASGGVSFTYLTRFDQNVGGPTFSVLNTSGYNSTFPSIQFQARGNLGATVGPVSMTGFLNYTGGFRYWGSTAVNPVITNAQGVPVGGGDKVKAYETIDLHASYDLSSIVPKPMRGAQVYVDVTNLFDTNPPFENTVSGANNSSTIGAYDPFEGNPIGRVVTLGVKAKF